MNDLFANRLFVRQAEVLEALCISESTLRRLIERGDFPAPVKATSRIRLYVAADVRAVVERWQREGGRHAAK